MKKRFVIILLVPTILGLLLGLYFDFFTAEAQKNFILTLVFVVSGFIVGLVAALAGAAGGAIGSKVDKEVFSKPTQKINITKAKSTSAKNPLPKIQEEPYSYFNALKDSLKILVFNEESLQRIANKKKATLYGFITLIIAGILSSIIFLPGLFSGLVYLSIFFIIQNIVGAVIGIFISFSIYHLISKFVFGGQATGVQYFRSLSNIFILFWLTGIPLIGGFIGFFATIWLIVMNIYILRKVHALATWKAVLLGLLPVILILFLGIILVASMFGGS